MKISGGVPLAFLLTSALVLVLIPSTTAEPLLWPSTHPLARTVITVVWQMVLVMEALAW